MTSKEMQIINIDTPTDSGKPILITEERKNDRLVASIEDKERQKLEQLNFLEKEIDKAFALHTQKEYKLISQCMPNLLYKGKEHFDQEFESMKQNVIEIDDKVNQNIDTIAQKLKIQSMYITHLWFYRRD